jgi:5-methylthioadenosine/S-adenosylhomocysteine deaminase
MSSILIKNAKYVLTQNAKRRILENADVLVEGNLISAVGKGIKEKGAEFILDGRRKAIIPGLVNAHTHAAMVLFRGLADDMELQKWLEKEIWPAESKLKRKHVYWGTRLACLEMVKSGTTCFNDMYFFMEDAAKAVMDSGIRGTLSYGFLDLFREEKRAKEITETLKFVDFVRNLKCSRVSPALGPHAVYTVSREGWEWVREQGMQVHTHLSETRKENGDCLKANGKRPAEYLDSLGVLNSNVVAAHCVWLTKAEVNLLAGRGVTAVHNPVSNMKLASGGVMPYVEMKEAGMNVALGTDGAASNNNLDMFEEMKVAALLQKHQRWDTTVLGSREALDMATLGGVRALKLDAGSVEKGKLADLLMIDLDKVQLIPNHNIVSNLVYSANGSCVDTVICDGRILMERGEAVGEKEVKERAESISAGF